MFQKQALNLMKVLIGFVVCIFVYTLLHLDNGLLLRHKCKMNLRYENRRKLKRIEEDYSSGKMLTGEVKVGMIGVWEDVDWGG